MNMASTKHAKQIQAWLKLQRRGVLEMQASNIFWALQLFQIRKNESQETMSKSALQHLRSHAPPCSFMQTIHCVWSEQTNYSDLTEPHWITHGISLRCWNFQASHEDGWKICFISCCSSEDSLSLFHHPSPHHPANTRCKWATRRQANAPRILWLGRRFATLVLGDSWSLAGGQRPLCGNLQPL